MVAIALAIKVSRTNRAFNSRREQKTAAKKKKTFLPNEWRKIPFQNQGVKKAFPMFGS